MKRYLITYNSGSQIVRCANKWEANKVARDAIRLLGWLNVTVTAL